MQCAHLRQQFAHVLRASARCRLIRHRGHPLDQPFAEQAAQRHQHQADGAITADVVLDAMLQTVLDHVQIDRIENDDGVVRHAQRGRRVDPIAIPPGCTQLGENLGRVVATLARDDHITFFQGVEVGGGFELGFVFGERRRRAACVAGAEKHRLDQSEIVLLPCIRCISTEPTMPRHPTRPTVFI